MADERRVHPDCMNASNPYHECVEYCFIKIAEAKARAEIKETGIFFKFLVSLIVVFDC
jgi:pre-mRNA-splicing factor SYF2